MTEPTTPQIAVLRRANSIFGRASEHHLTVGGATMRSVDACCRRGWLEELPASVTGVRWYCITDAGREALARAEGGGAG